MWVVCQAGSPYQPQMQDLIIKGQFFGNVLMPGQCRKQWPSIEPILRVYYMDSRYLLNATFDNSNKSCNSIQTRNVDSMLFYCWTSVAHSDKAIIQQRDKSKCLLGLV